MREVNPPGWSTLEPLYRHACRVLNEPPGPVHLLGIGGVGMAALAVLLVARGHAVSGCDVQMTRVTARLESMGIRVLRGHAPDHVTGSEQMIIRSPAVRDHELEWQRARAAKAKVFPRGAVLPALVRGRASVAVAGSHGKTTTTAMLAHILRANGRPLSFAIGGEIDECGTVASASAEGPLVVEADESDGTLALYEPAHAIITNVELDHVDFFSDLAALDACFRRFAERTRGEVWFCGDDPGAVRATHGHPRAHAFGFGCACALRAEKPLPVASGSRTEVLWNGQPVGTLELPVPGNTNVLDALGAMGAAHALGVEWGDALRALRTFAPVKRRFEVLLRNARATVISDYAHHPTEIRALLAQARAQVSQRIIAVFQPHRYSRTAILGPEFPSAFDGVARLVLAPVYAASEPPVAGGTHRDLARHFAAQGRPIEIAQSLLEAWELIRHNWRAGDVLLVVGAGDVEKIAAWAAEEFNG